MPFNSISKLLVLFTIAGLVSCEPDEKLTGVAAGASGLYVVTSYIVSGDTLFSLIPGSSGYLPGVNKLGVSNFIIEINATDSDRSMLKTSYRQNGSQSTTSKEVLVRLTNYDYQFDLVKTNTTSAYEGSVGRFTKFFYERTVGGGSSNPSP
ncbi:hypothetical protein [Spirosoma foliorum]|uniref:hypothetical protein n=1 Tax=Spirosoma foliorum TaxID=2710596 RepID=UPI001F0B173E|nr:hypothetical protein [Spirosoma foliorum]